MAPTAESVSDPSSPDYDKHSPLYDVTADSSSKYYVGPLKTDNTPSGDEIREMATQQIDDEIRAGWLGPAVDPVLRDKKIQELYQQHLDNAKHGLDEGLTMRENGGAPKTLWANASHEQMNDAITQDANPATVAETSEEWVSVGNDLGTHQKTLGDAINASTSNWQGDAGDAVREHLAGVGKWLGATAQGATLAGRQQEIHSQALNETQRQMVANPPVQFDLQATNQKLMAMTDPVQYAAAAGEAMQTYRAQTAARDHAAQIMSQYDETIGAAVATPRFPAPPKLPTATASARTMGTAAGGAGTSGAQPLMARTAMDPALDPTTA
ncbi:PPE domain-containing protein, partial [Amycolatopsis pretoriensis]